MLKPVIAVCNSLLLLSCGAPNLPGSITSPTTANTTFARSWSSSKLGYIYVASYFTDAQTTDPEWEAVRLSKMEQFQVCQTGKKVVRRDVRWFPSTKESGQRCSAIIYTVQCDSPTLAPEDSFEQDRREALLGEFKEAPSKGCGDKSRTVRPDEPDYDMKRYLSAQRMLVDDGGCDLQNRRLDAEIVVSPRTRIGSSATIDRALAARFQETHFMSYLARDLPDYPERVIGWALRRANKLAAIFPPAGKVTQSSANIQLVQTIGLGRDGRPYCVQLTARQGGRVWRRTIERSGADGYAGVGIFPRGTKRTDDISLEKDVRQLFVDLANSMGLPPGPAD